MNKSTMSVLFATMMAFSGFAAAQSETVKSGNDGGAGPTGMSGTGDSGASMKSRADVKAERMPQSQGIQGGEGAGPGTNPNTMNNGSAMGMTRSNTAAERNAARDQRRADRKAARSTKADASMGANSSVSGAIGETTVQGGGMGATGRTLGQGQPSQKQGNTAN